MKHAINGRAAALALAGALSACSGGGDQSSEESNQFCHTIPVKSWSCNTCVNQSFIGKAVDGHLATFGTIDAGGQANVAATSVRQPAGSVAGVYFTIASTGGASVTIRTFLNGAPQEMAGPSSQASGAQSCAPQMDCKVIADGESFIGFDTTMAYDAIEADVTNNGGDTLDLHEICVR